MNFLDAYDVPDTNTPPEGAHPEPSLNEEVSQVVGQLSRFWGGFRKQSQVALETARKDLTEVVSQAQKELNKLTTDAPLPEDSTADRAAVDTETVAEPSGENTESTPTHQRTSNENLFARLQNSLPPNIVSTVQKQLPESLKNASSSIDLAQLRTTLSTEFERVQGVTRTQAEEYVHKSEGILREAMKEAGDFLKEAVKVVPPEEDGGIPVGVMWDGTDVWMLPSSGGTPTSSAKGKEKETSSRNHSLDGLKAAATRAESLLKQLKHDPEVIRADPEVDPQSRELYKTWLEDKVNSHEDGINDSKWQDAMAKALAESVDGEALQSVHDILVPSAIPNEIFWTRYFFRVHQVELDEVRRKALIQGTTENEEDFSWEDDDDEVTSSAKATADVPSQPAGDDTSTERHTPELLAPSTTDTLAPVSKSHASTPSTQSPRHSSEDSYDVVSSQVSASGGEKKIIAHKGEDDEPDSDWE